jgi:hypothetical protein
MNHWFVRDQSSWLNGHICDLNSWDATRAGKKGNFVPCLTLFIIILRPHLKRETIISFPHQPVQCSLGFFGVICWGFHFSLSWLCLSIFPSICLSVGLSIKQARFVTMGDIGRMWPFFQLVPLGHLTEPSFGLIRLTAWPPGGGTWKSKQSAISPELSIGLSPNVYLKYRRLTQYIFHPSFLFDPILIHEGLPNGWRHHHGGLIFCIFRWVETFFKIN